MRIKRILLVLITLDIIAVAGYCFLQRSSRQLPFDRKQNGAGEYSCTFFGVDGCLKIEERSEGVLLKTWTAEYAPLILIEQVPELMGKNYELVSSIPISQTWQDEKYNYVFSHAVTDSGLCNYKFVQFPNSYTPVPGECMIDYAVAIDAE